MTGGNNLVLIVLAHRDRRRHRLGSGAGKVAMTDDAADGRALQRHGRRLGRCDRCRRVAEVTSATETPPLVTLARRDRRADRLDLADGFVHRVGEARRQDGQDLHVRGQQAVNFARVRRRRSSSGAAIVFWQARRDPRSSSRSSSRADVRRADDDADRRRGHAGRDLAVQRVHRSRGRRSKATCCRSRR